MNISGLIPAAGLASRLAPLPFSKELYPLVFNAADKENPSHPKAVMQFLLENFKKAGAKKVFVVIRDGKWDIPAYFKHGSPLHLSLAYLLMGVPFGPPYTIDQAYPFIMEDTVMLGFPDILVSPDDSFLVLNENLSHTNYDAVAGLYPVDNPLEWDMVKITPEGLISDIIIKKQEEGFQYAWATLVWKPSFSFFMHRYLQQSMSNHPEGKIKDGDEWRELIISDVLKAAITAGLKIGTHIFKFGKILDVGTTSGLLKSKEFLNNKIQYGKH